MKLPLKKNNPGDKESEAGNYLGKKDHHASDLGVLIFIPCNFTRFIFPCLFLS